MNNSNFRKVYKSINIAFMAIIVAIFALSVLYRWNIKPIPALLTGKTGIVPPSKGLMQAFSEIVYGNFSKALELNQFSLQVFCFFFIQLLFRGMLWWYTAKEKSRIKLVAYFDVAISTLLFIYCFYPLIRYTIFSLTNLHH